MRAFAAESSHQGGLHRCKAQPDMFQRGTEQKDSRKHPIARNAPPRFSDVTYNSRYVKGGCLILR